MNIKRLLRSHGLTVLLFVLAAGLLVSGTISGIRAAPRTESSRYSAQIELSAIGVTLLENGEPVARRDYDEAADGTWNTQTDELLSQLPEEAGGTLLGKEYPETLAVQNSGRIDAFVRVVVRRYWTDEDGVKRTDLDPALIQLELCTDVGWILDQSASTPERTVLYYDRALASGETTPDFCKALRLDPRIRNLAHSESVMGEHGLVVTEIYEYDGAVFHVETEVDAVQSHNAESAIRSAWGVDVSFDGERITLHAS